MCFDSCGILISLITILSGAVVLTLLVLQVITNESLLAAQVTDDLVSFSLHNLCVVV